MKLWDRRQKNATGDAAVVLVVNGQGGTGRRGRCPAAGRHGLSAGDEQDRFAWRSSAAASARHSTGTSIPIAA